MMETNTNEMSKKESNIQRTLETVPQLKEEPTPFDQLDCERALGAIQPHLEGTDLDNVRRLICPATQMVSIGMRYATLFEEDKEIFEASLKPAFFNPNEYGNMADRAKGFWYANILLNQASASEAPVKPLLQEAKPLRLHLLKAAEYLWSDHPELGPVVANIRSGHSHLNLADDLGNLSTLFVEHWNDAEGKCNVTKEEVLKAQSLGASIMGTLGTVDEMRIKNLTATRNLACEYLRLGIEELYDVACFVFKKDEVHLSRYPHLFGDRRRKKSNGKANGEDQNTQESTDGTEGASTFPTELQPANASSQTAV